MDGDQTDEWVRWPGGKCPVESHQSVLVCKRYAGIAQGAARDFRWTHDLYNAYGADDIVRYKLTNGA